MPDRISYYVMGPTGLDRAQSLAALRRIGCVVDAADAPVYQDILPTRFGGLGWDPGIGLDQLTDLCAALRRIGPGQYLTVPHLGHFLSSNVWMAVAAVIAARGAAVEDASTTGQVYDCQDPALGLIQLECELARQRGLALAAARQSAGIKGGRKKRPLSPEKMAAILQDFVDPRLSVADIARKHGFTVTASKSGRGETSMTLLRRVEDATGTMSRSTAIALHHAGKWPPERDLVE